jgi:hypothetical protein
MVLGRDKFLFIEIEFEPSDLCRLRRSRTQSKVILGSVLLPSFLIGNVSLISSKIYMEQDYFTLCLGKDGILRVTNRGVPPSA